MKINSSFVGDQVTWVALHVVVDYIVATGSIVDAVITLNCAASLVGRNAILAGPQVDRVAHQDKGHEHLAQTLARGVVVGVRILRIIREVDPLTVHTAV